MIKKMKFDDVILEVKTTIMKDGICYFGDNDIASEFESAVRNANFQAQDKKTPELIVLYIYKHLTGKKIKPYKITYKDIIYNGTKMSDYTDEE